MSKIRSKWTQQEKIVHNFLKEAKIGHKMHPNIVGHPDIAIKGRNVAIFIDGCFWHMCKKHFVPPKTHREYWLPKIEKNVERDKQNTLVLKKNGWRVIRIWEHEIKDGSYKRKLMARIWNTH